MNEQIQETSSLKRVFTPEQKSYYDKLRAEMIAISRGRTLAQMIEEKDMVALREWTKRKRQRIEFLETKKMPEARVGRIRRVERAIEQTQAAFEARAQKFGVKPPELQTPEIPAGLTDEHLEVFDEVFGVGNLEPAIMPTLGSLNNDYFRMMYPEIGRRADHDNGLISYRDGEGWAHEGNDFVQSMRDQMSGLSGKLIFVETILKPEREAQGYYGNDGTDPLQEIMADLFSEGVAYTRCFKTRKNALAVAAEAKRRIIEELNARRLSVPEFEVIPIPALLYNLDTNLFNPANSNGSVIEITSTDDITTDGGLFYVGGQRGGSAAFRTHERGIYNNPWSNCAFRLAVVFSKTK